MYRNVICDVTFRQAGSAVVNGVWVLNVHCLVLQLAAEINVKVWFYFDGKWCFVFRCHFICVICAVYC